MAHYADQGGGAPITASGDTVFKYAEGDMGTGTQFVLIAGAASTEVFLDPPLAQIEKQAGNASDMLSLRQGLRTNILMVGCSLTVAIMALGWFLASRLTRRLRAIETAAHYIRGGDVLALIPDPPGRIVSGSIKLGGKDLLKLSEQEMRSVRGNEISMIFQEPMTSLNPVLTIGDQVGEGVRRYRGLKGKPLRDMVVDLLRRIAQVDIAWLARLHTSRIWTTATGASIRWNKTAPAIAENANPASDAARAAANRTTPENFIPRPSSPVGQYPCGIACHQIGFC